MQEITIIGAGLVGCFMATLLTKKGFKVTIFEAQQDARKLPRGGRAINLALSMRGIKALKEIEYDETVLKSTVPMYGRAIHNVNIDDVFQSYSNKYDEVLYSTSRLDFLKMLLSYAESHGVKIHFQTKCMGVDFANKTVLFQDAEKKQHAQDFSILLGADGAHSTVRKFIEKQFEAPDKSERFFMGYKQFSVFSNENGKALLNPREAFHIWPGGNDMFFTALPNSDNSFNCALFSPLEGERSIQNASGQAVHQLFNKYFPSVVNLIDNIAETHEQNAFSLLWTVDAQYWSFEDKVALIGDSAHGVIPYYGLGVNVGFENCVFFRDLIDMHTESSGKISWSAVFQKYGQKKLDTDALARLSKSNAKLFQSDLRDPYFLFKKDVEIELERRYPDYFMESHALVTFKNISFVAAEKRIKLQRQIVDSLCENKKTMQQLNWSYAQQLIEENLSTLLSLTDVPHTSVAA